MSSRRRWSEGVRDLLGVLPDEAVARRAGVAQSTVTRARQKLGIAAARSRSLSDHEPGDVLRQVRARARAGGGMRATDVIGSPLHWLCRRHFGGWHQAVVAAGLEPVGRPWRRTVHPRQGGSIPMKLLGKVPDTEIAGRVGVGKWVVAEARHRLGIEPCPRASKATEQARDRLARLPKPQLERLLAGLRPLDQAIVRERLLADKPVTLAELGARFGVSRQRVAQRERRLRGLHV